MKYSSSVPKLPNDRFLIIRASYVKLCNGNVVAAAMIDFFEGWHNYKLKQLAEYRTSKEPLQQVNFWQHHTQKEIEAGIMGIGKRHLIEQAKDQLVSMGIIQVGRNPNPKYAFDATLHYLFCPEQVTHLLSFVENSKSAPFVEISTSEIAENSNSDFAENSGAIPTNTSTTTNNETNIPAGGDGKGEPIKPKKKVEKKPRPEKKKEPDKDWQRWIDRYETHVKKYNGGIGHNWENGSQVGASGLKGIRSYLVRVSFKLDDKNDDDCGFGSWCFILDHWDELGDTWLESQFDLTVIFKKIPDILNRLRNEANKNRGNNAGGGQSNGTGQSRSEALANY